MTKIFWKPRRLVAGFHFPTSLISRVQHPVAFLTIIFFLLILCQSLALAQTSVGYKIAAKIIDAGGAKGASASYQLLGKTHGRELKAPLSSGFIIGEGFLRSAYVPQVIILGPIVTAVGPATAPNSQPVSVTITGANFKNDATVKLSLSGEADVAASAVVVENAGKITCTFNITSAKVGLWAITVTNPDGRFGSLPSAFKITNAAPTIVSIAPLKGYNTEAVNMVITGNYFRSGVTVKLTKAGETDIAGENIAVESADKITCRFNIIGKPLGIWDLQVTNDDGQSAALLQAFKIEAQEIIATMPIISTKNPFNPSTGSTVLSYSLSRDAEIVIYIFNMRGEKIWEYRSTAGDTGGRVGANEILWDGVTAFKSRAGIGVYFVHLVTMINGQPKTLSKTKIAIMR